MKYTFTIIKIRLIIIIRGTEILNDAHVLTKLCNKFYYWNNSPNTFQTHTDIQEEKQLFVQTDADASFSSLHHAKICSLGSLWRRNALPYLSAV